jgi:hypothetical protein
MKETVSDSIISQFKSVLTMFKDAVLTFPESEWKIGDTDYLRHIQHHTAEMALELTKRCHQEPQ